MEHSDIAKLICHDLGERLTKTYGDFRPQKSGAIADYYMLIREEVDKCLSASMKYYAIVEISGYMFCCYEFEQEDARNNFVATMSVQQREDWGNDAPNIVMFDSPVRPTNLADAKDNYEVRYFTIPRNGKVISHDNEPVVPDWL